MRVKRVGILLGLSLWAQLALASQNAQITSEKAEIRENPEPQATVLLELKRAQNLRISNRTKNGWHRAEVVDSEGKTVQGWIDQRQILPTKVVRDQKMAWLDLEHKTSQPEEVYEPHAFSAQALGQIHLMSAQNIASVTNSSGVVTPYQYGFEAGPIFSPEWRSFFHLTFHGFSYGQTRGRGVLLAIIAEKRSEITLHNSMGFGIGIGGSLGNEMTETINKVDLTANVGMSPAFLLRVSDRLEVSKYWGVHLEFGLRFIRKLPFDFPNGKTRFADWTTPYFGLGIQYEI